MQWLSTARQLVIPFPETPPVEPVQTHGLPPRGCRACTTSATLLADRNTNPTLELLGVAVMLAAFLAVAVLA